MWPRCGGSIGVLAVLCLLVGTDSRACERPGAGPGTFASVSAQLDNDWLGGVGQDRGYTSGMQLSSTTRDLNRTPDPHCLPLVVRGIRSALSGLSPSAPDSAYVEVGVRQDLFTPSDPAAAALLTGDRPYAGVLTLNLGYIARHGDRWSTSLVRVGMVGPSALGEQTQNGAHKVFGSRSWAGWHNQLHDEPVLQLVHQRLQRWGAWPTVGGWRHDLIGHWGGALGNLATFANAGVQWRLGRRLPDDLGSHPRASTGVQVGGAPGEGAPPDDWDYHFFVSLDARAVAHNLALDGNTWKRSHAVDTRRFVADLGLGVTVRKGPWQLTFAHYNRTREFAGQQLLPIFGTLTVTRRF
jgi:hypothetical protein